MFMCSVCNVSLNSHGQLAQHQTGSKHLKKLKAAGLPTATVTNTVGVGATNPGEKRTYGNFVASDTLMPLKAQLITPPLKSMPNDNTSTSTDSDPPPPPLPPPPKDTKFQTASTVTTTETPPPPPPPPTVTPTGPTGQKQRPPIVHQIGTVGRPIGKQQSQIVRQQAATVQQPSSTGQQQASTVNQQPGPPGVNPVVQAIVDNALGKLPLKRKAYDGQCEICKVSYTSESHERQHLMGSKHAKKAKIAAAAEGKVPLAAFTGFNCTYCNVVLNSLDQLTAHREGQKHKTTVSKLQKQGKIQEECKDVTIVKV